MNLSKNKKNIVTKELKDNHINVMNPTNIIEFLIKKNLSLKKQIDIMDKSKKSNEEILNSGHQTIMGDASEHTQLKFIMNDKKDNKKYQFVDEMNESQKRQSVTLMGDLMDNDIVSFKK